MRSPLVPLAAGALTVVAVTVAALVWALFLRDPDPGRASEVVLGESPGATSAAEPDDGVVSPPPPVTDQDGAGDGEGTGETGTPSPVPSPEPPAEPPTGFPFDCLDGGSGHEAWGEEQWEAWWEACLDARYENGDDDDD
ncbi:hypothetical protein [Nocardiopsis sp. NPDC006938]|uniref:hypothetical protein n=1 Tax=Nocardiopsis sp. NPDC006938 TaxID=3364337 RepID=UPI0036BECC89